MDYSEKTAQAPQPAPTGIDAVLARLFPMQTMMPLLEDMSDFVENMPFDRVSGMAMRGLDAIGNKYVARYVLEVKTDEQGIFDVPDYCDTLEAVVPFTGQSPVYSGSGGSLRSERVWAASQVKGAPNKWVGFLDAQAWWGTPLPVARVSGAQLRLQVSHADASVLLIYKARLSDEQGLPLVTHKEAYACACHVNHVVIRKLFYAGQVGGDVDAAAMQQWHDAMNSAKNEGLGDKVGMKRILDAATSYHRHDYGADIDLK
jgi:hypothetical protein